MGVEEIRRREKPRKMELIRDRKIVEPRPRPGAGKAGASKFKRAAKSGGDTRLGGPKQEPDLGRLEVTALSPL